MRFELGTSRASPLDHAAQFDSVWCEHGDAWEHHWARLLPV
jgi:hypothetical protein